MSILNLEWWEYVIIIVLFFMAFLFINYVLKKFNEARIEDRLNRLLLKASNSQGTQIQELSLEIETNKSNNQSSSDIIDKCKPQLAGISLVFNKEDNVTRELVIKTDTSELHQKAKLWDVQKISKMIPVNEKCSVQKITSGKSNKLIQNYDNTKTVLPRSIVIKDSKDTCDATKFIAPSTQRDVQKPAETMYMKIRNTFLKPNKLEPKAAPKVTNIGSVFGKASKLANISNKFNLQISDNSEEFKSLENQYNLKKYNSKTNVSTLKENKFSRILEKNAETAHENSIESRLQITETTSKAKETFSSKENIFLKANGVERKDLTPNKTNIDNNLVEEQKITSAHSKLRIAEISNKAKNEIRPKEPSEILNSDNMIITNSTIVHNNTTAIILQQPETSEISVEKHLDIKSDGSMETPDKIEQPQTVGKNDAGSVSVNDFKPVIDNTTKPRILETQTTSQSTEITPLRENSDHTLNTEHNITETNSASSLYKHNNSRNDSSSSSITIGLLMTEISLKKNKMYSSTDSLQTHNLEARDNKLLLINIPVQSTTITNETSSYLQSEISTITEEIFFQKQNNILLQNEDSEIKSNKRKTDVIANHPILTINTSNISEPQTSTLLRDTEKTLSPKLSDTSRNKYNLKVKKFWTLFTPKHPT